MSSVSDFGKSQAVSSSEHVSVSTAGSGRFIVLLSLRRRVLLMDLPFCRFDNFDTTFLSTADQKREDLPAGTAVNRGYRVF